MLDLGWVPLEDASVESPRLCSRSTSAPFTGGLPSRGGPALGQLRPVPASLVSYGDDPSDTIRGL